MKRYLGWSLERSWTQSFCALSLWSQDISPSWHINVLFIKQEAPLTSVSWLFIGVSLHNHNWLNHWPHDWTQSPVPLSSLEVGDEWGGTENSNVLITGLVLSPTIKINSGRVERNFLWISKNTSITSVLLDIPSVLEALCWEWGQRSNQCISYITI